MRTLLFSLLVTSLFISCGKRSSESNSEIARPEVDDDSSGSSSGGITGTVTTGNTAGSTGGHTGGNTGHSSGGSSGGASTGGSTGTENQNISLYVGSKDEGREGVDLTGFSSVVDLDNAVKIDFGPIKKGKHTAIRGGDQDQIRFEFTSRSEAISEETRVSITDYFGTKLKTFKVETPLKQNGVRGEGGGIDTGNSLFKSARVAGLWKFSKPVSYWAMTALDVESSNKVMATVKAFDCSENLIKELPVVYPNGENGHKEIHFIGLVSSRTNICFISLTVGDKPGWILHNGSLRAIGIDDFLYGDE